MPNAAVLAAYRARREHYYRTLDRQQPWGRWWHIDRFVRP